MFLMMGRYFTNHAYFFLAAVWFLWLLSLGVMARSGDADTILLESGEDYQGTFLEEKGDVVRFRDATGEEMVFPVKDVARIIKEQESEEPGGGGVWRQSPHQRNPRNQKKEENTIDQKRTEVPWERVAPYDRDRFRKLFRKASSGRTTEYDAVRLILWDVWNGLKIYHRRENEFPAYLGQVFGGSEKERDTAFAPLMRKGLRRDDVRLDYRLKKDGKGFVVRIEIGEGKSAKKFFLDEGGRVRKDSEHGDIVDTL